MSNTESKYEYNELVTIMATHDRGLIAVVKSLLENAGIKYFINGESLLGLGRTAIAAEIQVGKEDADDARGILKDML